MYPHGPEVLFTVCSSVVTRSAVWFVVGLCSESDCAPRSSPHHCLLQICTEEQEDGEERPDLDLGLTISPVGPGPRAMKA
jgi:hypothetical protein